MGWLTMGISIVAIGNFLSDNVTAHEGTNFLKLACGDRPKLTALGEATAARDNNSGDVIRRAFAARVEREVGSVYPTTANHDFTQISFFSDGRVNIVNTAGTTHQFLTQRLKPFLRNAVVLEYVNGSSEWSVSVNGSPFEKRAAASSSVPPAPPAIPIQRVRLLARRTLTRSITSG